VRTADPVWHRTAPGPGNTTGDHDTPSAIEELGVAVRGAVRAFQQGFITNMTIFMGGVARLPAWCHHQHDHLQARQHDHLHGHEHTLPYVFMSTLFVFMSP
jgi:hypothetical protein